MPTDHAMKLSKLEAEDRITHVTIDHSCHDGGAFQVNWWAGEDGPYSFACGDDYLELRAGLDTWTRGNRYPLAADTVLELLRVQRMPDPIGWTTPAIDTSHLDRMSPEKRKRWEARLRKRRRQNPRV